MKKALYLWRQADGEQVYIITAGKPNKKEDDWGCTPDQRPNRPKIWAKLFPRCTLKPGEIRKLKRVVFELEKRKG